MSEFWHRKIRTFFRRLDCNNDGFLTKEDLELLGSRFAQLEHADSARRKTIRERFKEHWEFYSKLTPEGEKLTEERLVESFTEQRDDPEFYKLFLDTMYSVFVALDANGDGYIQKEEFITMHKCIESGCPEGLAVNAFNAVDTDHDGVLSFDEFRSACADFHFGEDENGHGTFFYGPLI